MTSSGIDIHTPMIIATEIKIKYTYTNYNEKWNKSQFKMYKLCFIDIPCFLYMIIMFIKILIFFFEIFEILNFLKILNFKKKLILLFVELFEILRNF